MILTATFKQRFLDRVASLEVGNPMSDPQWPMGRRSMP